MENTRHRKRNQKAERRAPSTDRVMRVKVEKPTKSPVRTVQVIIEKRPEQIITAQVIFEKPTKAVANA